MTVLRNSPECGEQIPYYSLRAMVRPGITGWAQVRYRYANNLEEEIEKMRYDLYYVKHRSLWLDLRILADTAKTVLAGPGRRAAGRRPARGRGGATPGRSHRGRGEARALDTWCARGVARPSSSPCRPSRSESR